MLSVAVINDYIQKQLKKERIRLGFWFQMDRIHHGGEGRGGNSQEKHRDRKKKPADYILILAQEAET